MIHALSASSDGAQVLSGMDGCVCSVRIGEGKSSVWELVRGQAQPAFLLKELCLCQHPIGSGGAPL